MQALYATCPSARLHLREPLSLSSELPLAAFVWILVKSPLLPFFLLSFSLTLSGVVSFAPCAVPHKHRHTERHIQSSDCFCQLFPTSASRHKGATPLLPPPTVAACHLWSECQVPGRLCHVDSLTVGQIGKIEVSMKQMTFNEFWQAPKE